MNNRYELTIEQIFNKQFKIDLKGYCAEEVDVFLDKIIHDYETYEENIAYLGERLQRYEEENRMLKGKISHLENKIQEKEETATVHYDNVDVLKRLTRLENEVFKNK